MKSFKYETLYFLLPADGYSSSDSYASDPEQIGSTVTRQRSVEQQLKQTNKQMFKEACSKLLVF